MASKPTLDPNIYEAVQRAISEMVGVRAWGPTAYVRMPLFYPNGTQISVKVEPGPLGFRVSDGGITYRELEQIGAETLFNRNAKTFAAEIDAVIFKRAIMLDVTEEELGSAIADIADATARIAHKVIANEQGRNEAEIADHLYERLKLVFGTGQVEKDVSIPGPSTKVWDVDAVVQIEGNIALFQAVTKHYASVYSTSAMFHDLALKNHPPVSTSVVRNKPELGAWFNILAQAGNVIEESAANEVYESAIGWR